MSRKQQAAAPLTQNLVNSVFASGTIVAGGNFTQQNIDNRQLYVQGAKGGFELLQDAVAHGAFHNSGERFDPPKCHPNTRVAVLKKIMNWISNCDPATRNALIMWLNGPAGSGKSAIAQSIAELCFTEGRLLASYFFGRLDPTRNHGRSLIPTIAYQICSTIPMVRDRIVVAIENDPLIFTRSLIAQFTSLIVEPLRDLFKSGHFNHPNSPRLIIIDGLDECLDREVRCNILNVILNGIQELGAPFSFLISSRPEHDISAVFNSSGMNRAHKRLSLDDSYLPNRDILLFLRDQFKEIKENHPFTQSIPPSWPTDDILQGLVLKSSGQFIYATTVVKYVRSIRHQPTHRLDAVLNIRSSQKDLPFAELDALYMHIFSYVDQIELVLDILAFCLFGVPDGDRSYKYYPDFVEKVFDLETGAMKVLFCDLGSLITLKNVDSRLQICIHHASLPDFLLDESRSKQFFIPMDMKCVSYLQMCMNRMAAFPGLAINFIGCHFAEALPLPTLRESILNFSITEVDKAIRPTATPKLLQLFNYYFLPVFLNHLRNSKFEDAEELHAHHLLSFDQFLIYHLEWYYTDTRLIFFVAAFDCEINPLWLRRFRPTVEHERQSAKYKLFQLDSSLLEMDSRRLILYQTCQNGASEYSYCPLVADFLRSRARAGPYMLDGTRYAIAALCCLTYLCDHRSQALPPRYVGHRRKTCQIPLWKICKKFEKRYPGSLSNNFLKDFIKRSERCRLFHGKTCWMNKEHERVCSEAFRLGLEYLPYLLVRSTESSGLIELASRCSFAPLSRKFPKRTNVARHAVKDYLERMVVLEHGKADQARLKSRSNTVRIIPSYYLLRFFIFILFAVAVAIVLYRASPLHFYFHPSPASPFILPA